MVRDWLKKLWRQFLNRRASKAYQRYRKSRSAKDGKAWYKAELKVVQEQGLVDSKSTVNVHNHTNTGDLLPVEANVLRLRREGKFRPLFSV